MDVDFDDTERMLAEAAKRIGNRAVPARAGDARRDVDGDRREPAALLPGALTPRPRRLVSSRVVDGEALRVERWARDARMLTIPDGTTQIHQLIIGRELVGMRAFA